MVSSVVKAAILALASCRASYALTVTILADTNRDGKVDTTGDSDVAGKQNWTKDRGALFLPNIVYTDRHCRVTNVDTMHLCHDAMDNVLRQSRYLAPLVTLPAKDLSPNAVGYVNVSNSAAAAERVRIFFKEGDEWSYVDEDRQFTAEQLKKGLQLGIDGRDVRRPEEWDGKATVKFSILDGAQTATDTVQLRVAPYLSHHHNQLAEQVFGAIPPTREHEWGEVFNSFLAEHNDAAGLPRPPTWLGGADTWVQDYFEAGYASIPGPDGPIVIRLMLLSHERKTSGLSIFSMVRNETVGAINFPKTWTSNQSYWGGTYDATGNLETIPPYTHNGKSYPAGRIIMGVGQESPLILPFLQLQETQDPLILDTAWLSVGHVDEFIQFIPAKSKRGWVLMADDPLAGLDILKKASAAGHGGTRALSRPLFAWDARVPGNCIPKSTIDFELARDKIIQTNEYAAGRIQHNIDIIKRETGITDTEIFRVPAVFQLSGQRWSCSNSGGAKRAAPEVNEATQDADEQFDGAEAASGAPENFERRQDVVQVHAHYPAAINGVVLSDSYYLAANPWGPVIDGVDIFAKAITAAYAKVNYTVHYIDTWFTHHRRGGEVHCGSNVSREPNSIWW